MALIRGGITVKPHVQALADGLERELGVGNFGTYNGHSPPEGPTQAIDIFTPDNSDGYALQDRICAWLIKNQKKYGVRYCIRRHYIWNIERADEGWRDQGVTGNRTADHYDHVHVTCYASGEVGVNTPPAPEPKIEEMAGMTFLIGFTSGGVKGQVWLWDSAGRIFTYVGDGSAQRAIEKAGVKYAGDYDGSVWEYFRGVSENAGFTG